MASRFDLEQKIMHCWGVVDDLKMLVEAEADKNAFASLATVYQYKFESLFKEFEDLIHEQHHI